ncbi:hypothetical protein SNE40_015830 [Patella caerulea]|uniref:Uncharacterized protein n=1 Tax=Patella caerulea TaxID=87958 RepID=A0AAN8JKQ9_PATCE
MAAVLNITLCLLSCLLPFIQASTGQHCSYYHKSTYKLVTQYCPYGCCDFGYDVNVTNNVCCEYDEFLSGDYNRNLMNNIIGIIVGVLASVIVLVVIIVIIVCCCCKRPTTKGHVIAASNTAVVYSNTAHPGVAYPTKGTDNPASSPSGYSTPPPAYEAVTSPEQEKKGFDTHINMN